MNARNQNNIDETLDAIQFSIKPVRLKLDGAPVAVHLLMTGLVEISANTAMRSASDAVSRLASGTIAVQQQPAVGLVLATAGWADIEALVTSGRLSM